MSTTSSGRGMKISDNACQAASFPCLMSSLPVIGRASSPALLQAQQHEDLPLPARQGLERLADQCAWPVDLDPADVDWLGAHGNAGVTTGDEQVADVDRRVCGVHVHFDAPGG